jgi:hypothetical protein
VAHTFAGTDDLRPQLMQIAAANVGQLHTLEIVPDAFIGIEIGRVAWQLLQVESPGRSSPEKVLDGLSTMDRRAIPDEEDLATDFAQEDTQEAHHGVAVIVLLAYLQEEPSVERDATDSGEMILAEPDAQAGCLGT